MSDLSKNKKYVFVNQSSGYLMIDIINEFVNNYNDVALIVGSLENGERRLNENVAISHIIKYNRQNSIYRLFTWFIGTIQIFFLLLFKYRGYHVVYVTNPPMSYFCSMILKNPYSVIVYDIYPDALRNIGIKESNYIYKIWAKLNKTLFSKAHQVYSLSESMANALSSYMPQNQIKVVPLWPMSQNFKPVNKKDNPFLKDNGLEDKFIVLYSGNMGYTHSVEVIVEVAAYLRDNERIHFLLIGDGKKKAEIANQIVEKDLTNCTLMDWQPFDVLPYSLASADIGVITLNEESAKVSVPSKTFNLLAVGAPLLCISPCESELNRLIGIYRNGKCFSPNDIEGIKSFIVHLASDREECLSMSNNSIVASMNFSIKNAMDYLS